MTAIDRRGYTVGTIPPPPQQSEPTPSLGFKTPVRVATTDDLPDLSGLLVVDGVQTVEGDRVLVKDQNLPVWNGIFNASAGAWSRAVDFDSDRETVCGAQIIVNEGSQSGSEWRLASPDPIVPGQTPLQFNVVEDDLAAVTHAAASKTAPDDNDEIPLVDSAASFSLKKLTWRNLLNALATAGWIRERLTANRTYYVSPAGSDSNDGLTALTPFLTLQKAGNVVAGYDLNGKTVVIQAAAGSYTAGYVAPRPFVGGEPIFRGDTANPGNVIVSVAGAPCFTSLNSAIYSVEGFKVATTSAGDCLLAQGGGQINITGKMEFGACAAGHMHAKYGGQINVSANYTISGNAIYHWWSETAGGSIQVIGRTITLSGTPAFTAFANATIVSQVVPVSNTYSGSATGKRYDVTLNAVILSAGATLPGSASGTTDGFGVYN